MSKRDAKLLAEEWNDSPVQLNSLIQPFLKALKSSGTETRKEAGTGNSRIWKLTNSAASGLLQMLTPSRPSLNEYRRIASHSPLDVRLLLDVLDRLEHDRSDDHTVLPMHVVEEFEGNFEEFDRWCRFQSRQQTTPLRSDILQASIEILNDDEIILRTDQDGSVKLRGTASVPMFLAFWRAPGHRLSTEIFQDIDRGNTLSGLERQSTRLCSRLQEVLIELVKTPNGFRMQRCRRG
jgi:hypothetical protein